MTLSISQRLRGTFTALAAIVLAVAGVGHWGMSLIRDENAEITRNWLPSVAFVNQMNTHTSDFRVAEFRHVLNTDDALMAGVEKVMATVLAAFDADDAAYRKLISSDEERRIYDVFKQEWAAYLAIHEKVIVLSRQNINDQAKALLEGEGTRLFDKSSDSLDRLVDLNRQGAAQAAEHSERTFGNARTALVLAAVLALAIAATASWWLIRSITVPLERAVQAADRVAAGQLGGTIEAGAAEETGRLLDALIRMQASLVATVGAVRRSSESIATASSQIAAGNVELGQRTETQATSLQQTAASMAQLTEVVKGNADSAHGAAEIAGQASAAAAEGGAAVREAVATMQAISESSRRIVDIIGVIDGIAFQTNILALNAAVEAARAGEQGRGFAVVASEVRTLAQRSASAAGEIKSLIQDSAGKVEDGTRRIGAAGETMSRLVTQVQRVNEMIVVIGRATQEQNLGISQAGQAVAQLDQVTQRNAALVEESGVATASLNLQAVQLVEAVRFFEVGAGGQKA